MKIEYSADGNTAFYGGYKFRRDQKTGYFLANKKTDSGHRDRLHVYVWRKERGEIPDGYHVHHIDHDKRNNDIDNLACIPGRQHVSMHGKERAETDGEAMRKNLIENAIPKAKKWHASAEGRAWHSEHAKIIIEEMNEKTYTCQQCGKEYSRLPLGSNKFCSNACKTKARFKSGVDDEERKCKVCGKVYRCNKYIKKQTCSNECGYILSASKRRKSRGAGTGLQHGG
jgi:hypothetical protein